MQNPVLRSEDKLTTPEGCRDIAWNLLLQVTDSDQGLRGTHCAGAWAHFAMRRDSIPAEGILP